MALAEAKNGLAERRVMKEFEETKMPNLVEEMRSIFGSDLQVEVLWDGLYCQKAASNHWAANLEKIYFQPMIKTFESICADSMGKEALQNKVKKIRICNTDGRYRKFPSFDGETLVFDHSPELNADYINERVAELTKFLESNL